MPYDLALGNMVSNFLPDFLGKDLTNFWLFSHILHQGINSPLFGYNYSKSNTTLKIIPKPRGSQPPLEALFHQVLYEQI